MGAFKIGVLTQDNQILMGLMIWPAQYVLTNGNQLSGWVWGLINYKINARFGGYLDGPVLRGLDNSQVGTLIGFKLESKQGDTFQIQFVSGTFNCIVYEVAPNAPSVSLTPQLIKAAPTNTPSPQMPTQNQTVNTLKQQLDDWMNQQAIDLVK